MYFHLSSICGHNLCKKMSLSKLNNYWNIKSSFQAMISKIQYCRLCSMRQCYCKKNINCCILNSFRMNDSIQLNKRNMKQLNCIAHSQMDKVDTKELQDSIRYHIANKHLQLCRQNSFRNSVHTDLSHSRNMKACKKCKYLKHCSKRSSISSCRKCIVLIH